MKEVRKTSAFCFLSFSSIWMFTSHTYDDDTFSTEKKNLFSCWNVSHKLQWSFFHLPPNLFICIKWLDFSKVLIFACLPSILYFRFLMNSKKIPPCSFWGEASLLDCCCSGWLCQALVPFWVLPAQPAGSRRAICVGWGWGSPYQGVGHAELVAWINTNSSNRFCRVLGGWPRRFHGEVCMLQDLYCAPNSPCEGISLWSVLFPKPKCLGERFATESNT